MTETSLTTPEELVTKLHVLTANFQDRRRGVEQAMDTPEQGCTARVHGAIEQLQATQGELDAVTEQIGRLLPPTGSQPSSAATTP